VMPDVRRQNATEVYAVDSVLSVTPGTDETVEYQPFYSFKHAAERERQHAFWYAVRRLSPKKGDNGTEVYLSLVDLDFRPTLPAVDTIVVHATCSNRDLPGKLPFGGDRSEF
jgi:type VI secretion system protein ImpG